MESSRDILGHPRAPFGRAQVLSTVPVAGRPPKLRPRVVWFASPPTQRHAAFPTRKTTAPDENGHASHTCPKVRRKTVQANEGALIPSRWKHIGSLAVGPFSGKCMCFLRETVDLERGACHQPHASLQDQPKDEFLRLKQRAGHPSTAQNA